MERDAEQSSAVVRIAVDRKTEPITAIVDRRTLRSPRKAHPEPSMMLEKKKGIKANASYQRAGYPPRNR